MVFIFLFGLFIFGLCWGSFLNALAYRMLHDLDWVTARSHCPRCNVQLAWYDLVPLISWLVLCGRCRTCRKPISWAYPAMELLCALLFVALWTYIPHIYFPAYALFFSALLITIRTDGDQMVIFHAATRGIIPFGLVASVSGFLPISFMDSLSGAFFGYAILWLVRTVYARYTKKEGIGLGDLDLLATIGAFIGLIGAWISLALGAILGLLATLIYCAYIKIFCPKKVCALDTCNCPHTITQDKETQKKPSLCELKIPFGPFLAFGAIIYIFAKEKLISILLGL